MADENTPTGIAKAAEGPNMAFIADCLRNYAVVLENGVIDNAGHYFPADIYDAAEQIEATPSPSSHVMGSEVTHEDICNTHEGGPCNCDWSAADEGEPHPDDLAVDRFAAAMKAKLAKKRDEGRGGWEDKDDCSQLFMSQLLREHVEKGDPVDVGNLAMMLHQREERISSLLETLQGE